MRRSAYFLTRVIQLTLQWRAGERAEDNMQRRGAEPTLRTASMFAGTLQLSPSVLSAVHGDRDIAAPAQRPVAGRSVFPMSNATFHCPSTFFQTVMYLPRSSAGPPGVFSVTR
jgi:hypothetical protein